MDENLHASPREDSALADLPEVEQGPPPISVIIAWCVGLLFVPLSMMNAIMLGRIGLVILLPLFAIAATMFVRKPWVWRAVMLYFPLFIGITLTAGLDYSYSRFTIASYLLLPAPVLGSLICICFVTRSARDYYHRTEVRQSV